MYEENPSLCSTLEPLYCSSHATAVGGIRFINFVDSGPTYDTRAIPQSLDRASLFSMCFLEEFTYYDLLMDPEEGTDDVTPYDACVEEMDMIGIGRILYIAPHKPHYTFDLFEVSIFETDGATPHDAYVAEMDRIGTSCILDVAPHMPPFCF